QLKEAYRYWFEESKTLGDNDLVGIKQRLYQFYELVNDSGIKEFQKAIETFKNWQKEILSSFAFDLHNGYMKALIIKPKSLSAMHLDFGALIVLDYVYYFIISIKKGIGGLDKEGKPKSHPGGSFDPPAGQEPR